MPSSTESFIRPEQFWRTFGLRANQTVVHLGSGAGFYLIPAAKIVGKKGRAIGIDVLEDMLQEAEGRAKREGVADIVETIRSNLENKNGSSLADNMADVTLVANILYQSDPVKIITEAARITKPGGAVIIVEWDVIATPLGPPAEQRVTPQSVRTIAEKVNLTFQKEFHPSPYHYGFLFTA